MQRRVNRMSIQMIKLTPAIIILICLFVVAFTGCGDQEKQVFSYTIPTLTAGDPVEDLQQFEERLESLRVEMNVPAISAAIVKNRQIVWARGFGYADLEKRVAATETTAYHLASITKSITSTVIMQLVEEGILDLEAPISDFDIELESPGIVRVKHLFTHTSKGIPGTSFDYDGGRFSLLDQVIEKALDRSFGELCLERIVRPLELTHTAPNLWHVEMCELWDVNPGEFEENMAKAYWDDGKTRTIYMFYFGTAAGLISSVIDVAKYSIAVDRFTLVSEETQALIFSPRITIIDHTTAYGLGWFIQQYEGIEIIWHGGCWDGTSGFLLKIPEKELTFIIIGNTRMLQIAYPQIRNDGDVTRSVIVQEFLNGFVFGDAELPDEPIR